MSINTENQSGNQKTVIAVRDKRAKNWFWQNNALYDDIVNADGAVTSFAAILGSSTLAVYGYLARRADEESQTTFPAVPTIAFFCGLSEPTVTEGLHLLVDHGLILRESRQSEEGDATSNLYTLLPLSNWTIDGGLYDELSDNIKTPFEKRKNRLKNRKLPSGLRKKYGRLNSTGFQVGKIIAHPPKEFLPQVEKEFAHPGQESHPPIIDQDSLGENLEGENLKENNFINAHQHHAATLHNDGDEKFSIEKRETASPIAAPSKSKKQSKREFVPSIDSLEQSRRNAAISLMEADVAPGVAVELARAVPPETIAKQIEWLPGRIQDLLDKGDEEITNVAGLLTWAVKNLAPKPRSFEKLERQQAEAAAERERLEREAREAAEDEALWNELSDAQRRALDELVLEKFQREYDNPMLRVSSPGFVKRRTAQLRDPETRTWLANVAAETKVAPEPEKAKSKPVEKAAAFEPNKKRLPVLSRIVTELKMDVEDGMVALAGIAAKLAENATIDDSERGWIKNQVAAQLTHLQRRAA